MMTVKTTFKMALMMAFSLAGLCSVGSAEQDGTENGSTLKIGPGVAYRSTPYRGDDDTFLPIPLILYDSDQFFFKGLTGGFHLFKEDGLSFDLLAQARIDGYEDGDSRHLRGMSDRRYSVDGGVAMSYFDGWGKTSLSFVTDLMGHHEGQEVIFGYGKKLTAEEWSITPMLGVSWQSSNLTDYYYGVRGKEANADRPEYSAGEAWNPLFTLLLNRPINEEWSFLGMFRYKCLDDEIRDSSIVNDDFEVLTLVGLMYHF